MQSYVWDPVKAEANFRKHGVRFEDAVEAFSDPFAYTEPDLRHSVEEDRQVIVGRAPVGDRIGAIVAVIHVERDETIRIISARPADHRERGHYFGG